MTKKKEKKERKKQTKKKEVKNKKVVTKEKKLESKIEQQKPTKVIVKKRKDMVLNLTDVVTKINPKTLEPDEVIKNTNFKPLKAHEIQVELYNLRNDVEALKLLINAIKNKLIQIK